MSEKPIVLVTEALPYFEKEKSILAGYATVKLAKSTAEDDLCSDVEYADVIMVGLAKITRKVIKSAKKLKGIVRYGIGVDNIDLNAATERRISVANVPDYCIGTVADHTFALLLALSRNVIKADKRVKEGKWGLAPELKGVDLEGKVYGIVGLGRIGRAVAFRAKGFGMKVVAYDPYVDKNKASELGVEIVGLDTLLKSSDFISIHVPLTNETRAMIGEKELRLMKKTAYLINVARGPVIDEKALIKALKECWIAGAGLDVLEKEPPDPDNPLLKLDNVVVSPHIAAFTEEAFYRLEMIAVKETIRILQGKLPTNLVNREICSSKG